MDTKTADLTEVIPSKKKAWKCDQPGCGRMPTTVHWLPWCVDAERVELACAEHDPGGYWLTLTDLTEHPQRVQNLAHVANKRTGGKSVELLLRRLYPGW